MKNKNTKLAFLLLKRLTPVCDREELETEFQQLYEYILSSRGKVYAGFWLWIQIIKSVPGFFSAKTYWNYIMFKNYLKIALRNILKQRGYSFINIASLALGLAGCFLVSGLIIYELSYDNFHENSENIYRINRDVTQRGNQFYDIWTPWKFMQALTDEYPEIINAARQSWEEVLVSNGEKSYYERCIRVDNAFFQMFSFPFVKGDKRKALTEPYSTVISEETAAKYFPDEEPVGKLLTINNEHDFQVTGVIKNIPLNSSIQFKLAVAHKSLIYYISDSWTGVAPVTYVQLNAETNVDEFNRKIGDFIQKRINEKVRIRLFLEPFENTHLSRYMGSTRQTLYIYSIFAFAILLIGCINFMNLSTARSAGRAKEIGIRKVVGAFRKNVAFQFLGESLLLSFISFFAALALAGLLFPLFKNLIKINTAGFTFLSLMKPDVILVMTGITIFTGFAAGCYPAIMLSGFSPVKILKGHLKRDSKGLGLRKILVVTQFSFSIFLIIGTVVIFNQLSFLKNKEIGYNKEQIVNIPLRRGSEKFYSHFKNQLLIDSRILGIGGISTMLPYFWQCSPDNDWEGKNPGQHVIIANSHIDYDFLETLSIRLLEGRNFSKDLPTDANSFIVNETLAKKIGATTVIGKRLTTNGQTGIIIGVMKDFIFRPLNNKTWPLVFRLGPDKVRFASIRIQKEDIATTLNFIEKTWKKTVPMYPFKYSFLDADFDKSFREIETLGKLLTTCTIISIFISCLGLLGLAAYTVQQRTKEIGIRKVLGASVPGIMILLSKEFSKWVIIANIIAWPVAYFFINRWLQNFAYRTDMNVAVFFISGIFALLIALLTISHQVLRTANANPVNALRYE